MKMTRRLLVTMLELLIGVTAAKAQAQPAAPATPPITTFNVDLTTRTSNDRLPFDEPFLIRATVKKDVSGGGVRFVPIRRGVKCDRDAVKNAALQPGEIIKGTDTNELRVLTDAEVKPNQLQCFAFELETPLDTTLLRPRIKTDLDLLTRDPHLSSTTLSLSQLQDLQKNARKTVEEIVADNHATLKVQPGSAFDINPSAMELTKAFAEDITPVISAQHDRDRTLGNYCFQRRDANAAVLQIATAGQPVLTVLDKIEATRLAKPKIEAVVSSDVAAYHQLRNPGLRLFAKDTTCSNSGTPDPSLLQMWEQTTATAQSDFFGTLASQVGDVSAMVNTILYDNALISAIGSNPVELKAAIRDLDLAAGRLSATQEQMKEVGGTLARRDKALDDLASRPMATVESTVRLVGTSVVPFEARQKMYVSADVGFGTAWEVQEAFGYAGVNFYSRAINRNATLDWNAGSFDWWRKRFSAMVGVTMQDITRTGAYDGVLGHKALVAAVGFRVLEGVRVSLGGLAIREIDRNPLVDARKLTVTPFASFSVDVDVANILGKLGTAIGVSP